MRSDDDRAIREEIELYLELRTEELIEQGMSAEEARAEARRSFGDANRIESELHRQAVKRRAKTRTRMTMGGFMQDVRYALRTFRKNPAFTVVAVVTLGLALGGNTAIFSVVDAALIQAMPFEDADELVFVNGTHVTDGEVAVRGASFPEFYDWQGRARGVSPMAAVAGINLSISGDGEAESLSTEMVTKDYFAVMRGEAVLGRTFSEDEHVSGDVPGLVVISEGLWDRRYGRDSDVLGRNVVLNEQSFTVVGVMPAHFVGTALNTDLWIPESNAWVLGFDGILEARGSRFLSVVGRLNAAEDQAQQELDVIARDLQAEWPSFHEDRFAQIQGFRDAYLDGTGSLLWVLLGSGAVLLLIAAANVANLLLVRAHGRTREIVLRRAVGAEGGRIASQLLVESLVLAGLGGVLGAVVAYAGLEWLTPMIPQGVLPGYVEVDFSTLTFAFSFAVLGVIGLAMGLAPAVAGTRVDLAGALREGGRNPGSGRSRFGVKHLFVVTQVALALVLLVGAGLLTRSFQAQMQVDTGSDFRDVVAMRVSLPGARYPDADARRNFADELKRSALAMPGVTEASVSSDLPFRGGSSGAYVFKQAALDERIRFHRHSVGPDYLNTIGLELVAGRFIEASDGPESARVGVITEAMVQREFDGRNPIGETMYLRPGGNADFGFEVIGVLRDVRFRDLTTSMMAERNSPDVFFPYAQQPSGSIELAVRVQGEPASFVEPLRELVAGLDPDLPTFQPAPMYEAYRTQTATPRFAAFLMGLFSVLAAILACVGIYGVLAFTVGQRAQEIAIRRAIGATAPDVARRVVVDGVRLAGVGLVVGGVAAALGGRVLDGFLFGVPATDPMTFGMVGTVMLGVATLAALVPAMRAARKDPAEVLGSE